MRLLLAFSIATLLLAATLSGVWFYHSRPTVPTPPREDEPPRAAPPVIAELPAFRLIDQHGKPFESQSLKGKVWVADFIFTRCQGPCPRMTATMASLQRWVPGLTLVSISADPKFDTPEVLAQYASQVGAEKDWHFLTGQWTAIHDLALGGFKVTVLAPRTGEPDTLITHGTRLILVDAQGRIRGYYSYNESRQIEQLTAQAKTLVAAQQ